MNREIEFRGKRLDGGEWVYGHLREYTDASVHITTKVERALIRHLNGKPFYTIHGAEYQVDPETVGQYTGLRDENGVKIFEGDIVNYHTIVDCRGIVSFGRYEQDGSGDEYAPSKCIGFFIERKWVDFDDDFAVYEKTISLLEVQGLEVIGNIHDNPELLGV